MQRTERQPTHTVRARQFDLRLEGDQSHREIARILRNTTGIDAEHRMVAVETRQRRTTRTGPTLVAGRPTRIAKITATSSLQHVAAQSGHVPQLRAGGELQTLGNGRIALKYVGMVCDTGHLREGAETQAGRAHLDPVVRGVQRSDVDDFGGPHDVELHQVQQRGSTRQKLRPRVDLSLPRGYSEA